jgi:serine protease Do
MRYKALKFVAITLLATACYAEPKAQQAPPPPGTPAAPQMQAPESPQKTMKERKQVRIYMTPPGGSYLGVDPRDVTSDRAGALKLNESRGVEVMMVDRDSPAGKAGLKEHDVILNFDGKPVADADQLRHMLHETQPGKTVPLAISRGGQSITLNVTLTKRPEEMAGMQPFSMPSIPMDFDIPSFQILQFSKRNGMMVEDLTPQLADFFGVKNGGGVLVRSVDHGSAADSAGLKAGDVIVKAGNDPISCSSDWGRIMHQRHGTVSLGVIRDKHEQSVTLKLPEKSPESSLRIELPDIEKQMRQLRAGLESQRPEIERQVEIARANIQSELRAHQKELEQAMKLRDEDIERAQQEAQRALEKALEQLKN